MKNQTAETIKQWYLLLITGIVFIGIGIWVFRTPETFYTTLATLFALAFLVTGLIEIIYALVNRKELNNWGWSLTGGIIDLVLGIWLISRSALSIAWAFTLKKYKILDWGGLLAVGILGLIIGFIMLWNPRFAGMTIVFYTGFAFILIGCLQIYLSFKLKKLNKLIT